MTGVQITDLYHLKSLSQPWPYKDQVFFVQNGLDEKENDYTANIFSIDSQQNIRQFTDKGLNLQPMVVNSDLYFRSLDNDGLFQLMKMPIDGGAAKQLTTGNSVEQTKLSLDHGAIFFKTVHTPGHHDSLTTRHVTKIQNRADGIGWLPTDNTYTIERFDVKTGNVTTFLTTDQNISLADINPQQDKILYLAANHPDWTSRFDDSKGVYLYDLKQKQSTLLTDTIPNGVFTDAHFSPDGCQIAMIGSDYTHYTATPNQLYLYDFETQQLTNITGDQNLDVGYGHSIASDLIQNRSGIGGAWLSDNAYLFTAYHHGHSQLYLWDGQRANLVDDNDRDIADFAIKHDHQVVFVSSSPSKPAELKILDLAQHHETDLYNPNQDYEKDHEYAAVSSFYYPSSDQKVQLQGWFTPAQDSTDKAPLILYIHGGPHAAYGDSFFHEFQALAAQGFNVAYFNPRGSTSYGEDFATDVMGHYGENDYADVMAGLDYVLDHFPAIDPDKIFIAGGSYGGFLSTWIISHTDRFQAAIVQRPAIDWLSLYTNSDIGVPFVRAELGADLYADNAAQLYWEKSPLAHAQKIKTPVRIQHGELDCRCPVSQSEALFLAIKSAGTECDYIRYPKSYHGLSRNGIPSLRVQRIQDIVDWFKHHAQ